MQVKDLFEYEDEIFIDRRIDREKRLLPVFRTSDIREDSILIYPKRLGTREYRIPALSKAPYAIIAGEDVIEGSTDVPLIKVPDPRRCAAFTFSKEYGIDYNKLSVIGITGTNGKTTTAEILFYLLRAAGYNVGYIGTGEIRINENIISDKSYSMTTPDPDDLYKVLSDMQRQGCDYAVMEVSSHSLSLSKVTPIKFKRAIFTNLTEEHMDFHTDLEDYYHTKLSLFRQAESGIFNLDDPYSKRALGEAGMKGESIGIIDTSADACITAYTSKGLDGSAFFYKEKNIIFKIKLALGGAYNVYNSMLAIKCAISLGVNPCTIRRAIPTLKSVRGRLNVIKSDVTVVIDYAHTSAALKEVLFFLKSTLSPGQSLTTVFGCGGERDKSKRAEMGKIAESFSDIVVVTEDNSRGENFDLIVKMILSGMTKNKHIVIESRSDAIRTAILSANKDDIVAVIGKGHEKYIIDSSGKHDFDEEKIIMSALEERKLQNEN